MALMTDQALERRSRWLYELGRARSASRVLWPVLAVTLAGLWMGRSNGLVLGLGSTLTVLAFSLAMFRDRYAGAVMSGIAASLPALVLPFMVRAIGLVRLGQLALDPCIPASFVSGLAASAIILSLRPVESKHRLAWFLAAAAVAGLSGAAGCLTAGPAGVLGLLAGVVVAATPALVRDSLRSS